MELYFIILILTIIIVIVGVISVGVLGILYFTGVIGNYNSGDDTKISISIYSTKYQSVDPIDSAKPVVFSKFTGTTVFDQKYSDEIKDTYFYYNETDSISYPAGAIVYSAGVGPPSVNATFSSYILAGDLNTSTCLYQNGKLLSDTQTAAGSSSKIVKKVTMKDGDYVVLYNTYLNTPSQWLEGSYYQLEQN